MIPGQYRVAAGDIELNAGRQGISILIRNSGDRPVQVGSHYHFFEVNRALSFDREAAYGMRLDIAAGTAVRFEPGEEKPVNLVMLGGARISCGLNGLSQGEAKTGAMSEETKTRLAAWKGE